MFGILPWKRKRENHANEYHREIDNLYDRFFEPNFLPSTYLFGEGKWDPTLDISEGRKDITVKAEIPGIEAKDFDISIDGRLLTIKGENQLEINNFTSRNKIVNHELKDTFGILEFPYIITLLD